MKVSIQWLKELVDLNCSLTELINLLPLRSISTKEATNSYIELDMKGYNRADLLSMRGVALEVAAITDSKVKFEESVEYPDNEKMPMLKNPLLLRLPKLEVKVQNPELCPVYCLLRIDNLKVGPSSKEWIEKLESCGMRSVNNVADITNLIMLEYGQPFHAFDADKVKNQTINVRVAYKNEQITTLDDKSRKLMEGDLLITDSSGPIAIAGVMGGKDSEVSNSTTSILLEAAIFDSATLRKTAMSLGIQSEAVKRFYHGLTRKRLKQALRAAIKLYGDAGGKVNAAYIPEVGHDPIKNIYLSLNKAKNLIGMNLRRKTVEKYMRRLNIEIGGSDSCNNDYNWNYKIPYYRLDLELEVDLIEEVARMYGYEKIPAQKVAESEPLQKEDPIFKTISDLRKKLVDLGLTEVQTYSFYSTDVLSALGFDDESKKDLVKVANPISAETEYLRMNLWPNLVQVVGKNLKKGFDDIAIFEIGKAFSNSQDGNPREEYRLSIALYNGSDNPLKELHKITQDLNLSGIALTVSQPQGVGKTLFHPKRFLSMEKDNKFLAGMAEVHLRVLNNLGIEKRVAILEIELEQN